MSFSNLERMERTEPRGKDTASSNVEYLVGVESERAAFPMSG
jgi:hypothetical protein